MGLPSRLSDVPCDSGLYNHFERIILAQAGPPGLGVGAGVVVGEGHGHVCAVATVWRLRNRASSFFTVVSFLMRRDAFECRIVLVGNTLRGLLGKRKRDQLPALW